MHILYIKNFLQRSILWGPQLARISIYHERWVARSGFSDLGNSDLGGSENEKRRFGVRRPPHLKIEKWATQIYRGADLGQPPIHFAMVRPRAPAADAAERTAGRFTRQSVNLSHAAAGVAMPKRTLL